MMNWKTMMIPTVTKVDGRSLALWLCLVLTGGCAGFGGEPSAYETQQGTAEEVRLKAVLLEAEDLAGSAIDITVNDGGIVLEGFVETTAQRQRAEDLMREYSDMDDVTNRITVK
ncbi:BON domain-containing protein [Marinobacter daqiaonensis]|uniref:BON domain-containing protein n=1 Tax=Marinobacter daqiaonensis TaxID=650891 RepID=A0A1I6GIP4_9GAMM|nr:BON domain-containing protein [Marinobacter daqiaonensis]SFR42046.1 BON domain-containing protein [Marinobacter daqiaonensis]